jgi:hypothetical protein
MSLRSILAILVVALIYGGWIALDSQAERSTSWPVYLGLVLVAGILALCAEGVVEKISAADSVGDSLGSRLGRLVLLLLVSSSSIGILYWLIERM